MIKIKLTISELRELLKVYGKYIPLYEPANEHEDLLFEHMVFQYYHLLRIYNRVAPAATAKKRYTWNLHSRDALAFYQVWQTVDLLADSSDSYASVIVCNVIAAIDHYSKTTQTTRQVAGQIISIYEGNLSEITG